MNALVIHTLYMHTNIQIVATIGPASKDKETLHNMVDAGMSLARLNFSWGTHEEHASFAAAVREIAAQKEMHIPILQDLSGPRIQEGSGHTYDPAASVITEKDRFDLAFAAHVMPEYIALSFVRNAADVAQLRALCVEQGIASKIIAKIERQEALEDIDAIIAEADGIMVARGDLGEAIPFQEVPFVQKEILVRCKKALKPSIVATEMLTSMISKEQPSRADVSDIAHAVLDGASATMLSNETAVGMYPIETVRVMRIVLDEAASRTEDSVEARF